MEKGLGIKLLYFAARKIGEKKLFIVTKPRSRKNRWMHIEFDFSLNFNLCVDVSRTPHPLVPWRQQRPTKGASTWIKEMGDVDEATFSESRRHRWQRRRKNWCVSEHQQQQRRQRRQQQRRRRRQRWWQHQQ